MTATGPAARPAPELLAALARAGPALALLDGDGRITWCSQAFAEAVGGEAAALQGTRGSAWIDPQHAALHTRWHLHEQELGGGGALWHLQPPLSAEVARLHGTVADLHERIELLQEFCNAGIWERDPVTMAGQWDAQMYRIFGLPVPPPGTPSPAYAEASQRFFQEDREPNRLSPSLARPGAYSTRLRLRRSDGQIRHIHSQWRVFHDAQGHAVRVLGVNIDDTETYAQAVRTQQITHRLESAAEAARIGLWSSLIADDAVPDWNLRNYELFGLDPTQGPLRLGEWLRRCTHPDDRARVAELGTRWARGGSGPFEIEFRAVPPDGRVRWLITRGLITHAGDAPARMEGVTIDVTEQHETQQRLRESSQRIELAVGALGMGTWELPADTGVMHWDTAMFRLRGVDSPARDISREEIWSYLHPDDHARIIPAQMRSLERQEGWSSSFRVVWPDGTVRWLASRSQVMLDPLGQPTRRFGLNWDITELMQVEQALRERELALDASRAKSRFLSRISHELRTPLNAVLGFTQLLRSQAEGQTAAERQNWLAHIDDAGRLLLALIDDVLDLSRAEAGDLRLEPQSVAVADLVRGAVSLVEQQAQAQGVALHVDPLPPGHVHADPLRARQVLLNLLSNAIKYRRVAGGAWVRMEVQPAGDTFRFTVSDNGRGIAPEQLQAAFEPFNRLGAERLGIEGTGIGLAIAKLLVEQMQGRITVHSQVGEGSSFSFTLPAAQAVQAPAPSPAPLAPPLPSAAAAADRAAGPAPRRVLYIEDNAVNALLVSELLAGHAWVKLEIAVDGKSGLEQARAQPPDLVLLDMQLPDMSGLAVLAVLQADAATAHVPCVALSANAMPDDIEAARTAGVVDYWTKPIAFPEFLSKLAALLATTA